MNGSEGKAVGTVEPALAVATPARAEVLALAVFKAFPPAEA